MESWLTYDEFIHIEFILLLLCCVFICACIFRISNIFCKIFPRKVLPFSSSVEGWRVHQGYNYSREMKFYCNLWFFLTFCHYKNLFYFFTTEVLHICCLKKENENHRKVKIILPFRCYPVNSLAVPSKIFLHAYMNIDMSICAYTSIHCFF